MSRKKTANALLAAFKPNEYDLDAPPRTLSSFAIEKCMELGRLLYHLPAAEPLAALVQEIIRHYEAELKHAELLLAQARAGSTANGQEPGLKLKAMNANTAFEAADRRAKALGLAIEFFENYRRKTGRAPSDNKMAKALHKKVGVAERTFRSYLQSTADNKQ